MMHGRGEILFKQKWWFVTFDVNNAQFKNLQDPSVNGQYCEENHFFFFSNDNARIFSQSFWNVPRTSQIAEPESRHNKLEQQA